MSRLSSVKESLDEWNEEYGEDLVSDEVLEKLAKFDEENYSVQFSCDFDFTGHKNCSIIVPESYPRGIYNLCAGDIFEEFKGKNLCSVLQSVMKKFKKIREKAMRELVTPTSDGEIPFSTTDGQSSSSSDDDDDEDSDGFKEIEVDELTDTTPTLEGRMMMEKDGQKNFERLIDELNWLMNEEGVFADKVAAGFDNVKINLLINPRKRLNISELVANCWGVDMSKYIVISLTITSYNLAGLIRPEIQCFQGGETSLEDIYSSSSASPSKKKKKSKFGLLSSFLGGKKKKKNDINNNNIYNYTPPKNSNLSPEEMNKVSQVMSFTSCEYTIASNLLAANDWNVQNSINLFFETGGIGLQTQKNKNNNNNNKFNNNDEEEDLPTSPDVIFEEEEEEEEDGEDGKKDSEEKEVIKKSKIPLPKLGEHKDRFGLSWTVTHRLQNDFFRQTQLTRLGRTEKGGKNFLLDAVAFVERTLNSSPYYCLYCGQLLEHVGIKPTVCANALCVFSHEQYGMGIDLESEMIKNSDIVDLLISMAYAAASSPPNKGFNPFSPYPNGVEGKTKCRKTNTIIVHNFMKDGLDLKNIDFSDDSVRDNQKVLSVISRIPSLRILKNHVLKNNLRSSLDCLDPRMYSLIRWIMTSNRAHLHKLSKANQITEMKTEHQYIMMTGTAEKEAKFQQLKQKHGSIQAWHGSPLYNWHAILRTGLKNMSNTKGMLHGAAGGAGIYFGSNSQMSLGYSKQHGCWGNSMFGSNNLMMIALCEIINHPEYRKQSNPYGTYGYAGTGKKQPTTTTTTGVGGRRRNYNRSMIVIPENDHVQTRMFFVYPQFPQGVNVPGSNVKIPEIKWWRE